MSENENKDSFDEVARLSENEVLEKLKDLVIKHQDKPIAKVFKIDPEDGALILNGEKSTTYGMPPIRAIMRDLIYLDMLEKANASLFFNHHAHRMTEDEREKFMEKYGVQIDKKKRDDTKKGVGEKTAGVDDPNVNVPKDPDKGTEPFEKDPENGQG